MSVLLTLAAALALAQPSNSYTNPVYTHDFPDPYVIRHDGRFFAYATQTRDTGFQVMDSPDLVHWTPRALDFNVPWSRQHLWAPEVYVRDGTFYLTYSALDPESKKHHIGIATATHPTGPFTHRALLVRGDDNRTGVIDATIALDDHDIPFLVYSEENPRRIVARRLRDDLLATQGDPIELIRPDRDDEAGVVEAPTIVRRDGMVHLFYSGGPFQGTKQGDSYSVRHAVAPTLLGPYTKSDTPLLSTRPGQVYGPGHQCVIQSEDGTWWMLYHAWDAQNQPRYGSNPLGRTLRLDPLTWIGATPKINGPTLTPQPAPGG